MPAAFQVQRIETAQPSRGLHKKLRSDGPIELHCGKVESASARDGRRYTQGIGRSRKKWKNLPFRASKQTAFPSDAGNRILPVISFRRIF